MCVCLGRTGYAHCSFWWITPTSSNTRVVVPMTALYVPRHIPGSPFDFVVKAGSAAANGTGAGSVAFGPGLVSGTAGRTLSFSVASRDKFGNDRCGWLVGSRVLWLDLCPSCCVFWVWQTIGCEPVVCTWVCMRMWWRGGVPRPPTQFSSTCNPTPRGDCSMLDGQTDEFRVLAVRRNNSGPGFGGSSGGIGVAEVAGDVSFNPSSLYHDVQWRPLVSVLVCVCACARERQLCVLPLCSVLFVMETMSRLECSLLPSPPPLPRRSRVCTTCTWTCGRTGVCSHQSTAVPSCAPSPALPRVLPSRTLLAQESPVVLRAPCSRLSSPLVMSWATFEARLGTRGR